MCKIPTEAVSKQFLSNKSKVEYLTLAILHLLIGLRLYIGGPLNQLPNYLLTKTTNNDHNPHNAVKNYKI